MADWIVSPSRSSADVFMSLYHRQVGTFHRHLWSVVSAALDVSCHDLRAGALTRWSVCSQHRGLAGRRGSRGNVWGWDCQAGVAQGAPGGFTMLQPCALPDGTRVPSEMCRFCSRLWLIASPAVLKRCSGGGVAEANMLWSGAAHS